MGERHLHTNHLIGEKSPHLQQHAHNPVDWYPWSPEAFEAAVREDKPIFLSIGYATCHWCHVMERESFCDEEIAHLMNESFINIKVDREEMPEVDSLYMDFAQSMISGASGWPLNLVLTPQLAPFFAATYLPPLTKHGVVGLREVVTRIRGIWRSEERHNVEEQSQKIVDLFQDAIHTKGTLIADKAVLNMSMEILYKVSDPLYGGMKGAPKFPIGYQINLLLHYSSLNKDSRALFLAERALVMMQRGGIHDHLGGGFARYSVDDKWHIPHFEKMAYDNALLAFAYLEMWQATKRNFYREVCVSTLDYILRVMSHPAGGFYAAEDAESEGHEGAFYTWTKEEILKQLPGGEGELFCSYYNVTSEGNFEGRNVLFTDKSAEEFAASKGLEPQEFTALLHEQQRRLLRHREEREHPFKDNKIITSWNGLLIHAFASAGAALNHKPYYDAAVGAARFIREELYDKEGLLRSWCEGVAGNQGNLDDHAFLIHGLLTLFEVQGAYEWLQWAVELTDRLSTLFKAEHGAFFFTDGVDPYLLLRKCIYSDGAEPSGNALHCENLLRLWQLTGRRDYLQGAEEILMAVRTMLEGYSMGYGYHLLNLIRYYRKEKPTIVVSLNEHKDHQPELKQMIHGNFIPCKAVIWRHDDEPRLFDLIEDLEPRRPLQGKTTLYLCYEGVCHKPITELSEMIEVLHQL